MIMTDEMITYPFALDSAGVSREKHKTIPHRESVYVDSVTITNGIEPAFSLLKRDIIGS